MKLQYLTCLFAEFESKMLSDKPSTAIWSLLLFALPRFEYAYTGATISGSSITPPRNALIAIATISGGVQLRGKMAVDKTNEVAKAVNSFDHYSANDQQSLIEVMTDYFTSQEDLDDNDFFDNEDGKF